MCTRFLGEDQARNTVTTLRKQLEESNARSLDGMGTLVGFDAYVCVMFAFLQFQGFRDVGAVGET